LLLQSFTNSRPRSWEILGQNPRFADGGHKVRIRHPSGKNVHVDVAGYARSSGLTNIHPNIYAIRAIEGA
jgi:hypothetical protein